MSELIDREALKDAVKRYAGEPIKEKDRKCQAICLDMLGTIDAQPTASPWHRVEDGLPKSGEFGEIVLACNDVGTVKAAYLSRNGKWYAANNMDWDAWTWMPNVTHWMPMPEPPKEDALQDLKFGT